MKAQAFLRELAGTSGIDARATAVVAAHPDDEVVGAGGQLSRLDGLWLIHVTDGAPRSMDDARAAGFSTRESYAAARRRELEAAAAVAGIAAERLLSLGIVDQEATMRLCEAAVSLRETFAAHGIRAVITHAYEGGHPDHDATAFAVHAACALLRQSGAAAPALVEMAGYHAVPAGVEWLTFLPMDGAPELTIHLDIAQRAAKRRLLDCYTTQGRVLAQVGLEVERFRPAPRYDFAAPPHAGPLWYERFTWGCTGEVWREKAREAQAALELPCAGAMTMPEEASLRRPNRD